MSRPQVSCLSMFLGTALLLFCSDSSLAKQGGVDWTSQRGPLQNHSSPERDLVDSWDPKGGPGSNLLWKNAELGGRSTPIVMRGRLYTIVRDKPSTPDEGSKVVCVDAATGEKIWEHRFNVYLTDVPDTRVGWSTCVGDPETGRVYALCVSGYFCCLEGDTGSVVWERSLHEEFGLLSTYGGRTNSPLIFEDQVLISAVVIGWGDAPQWGFLAKPAHRFLSFDKATGSLRWLKGTGISPYDTTYSMPTIAVLGGQAAMVFGSGDGNLWALQPRTGEGIWNYPFSRRGINTDPLVVGNVVYASQSEENIVGNTMGSLVKLDGSLTGDLTGSEKWQQFEVMAGKSSPIMVGDQLWVVDDGAKLSVFNTETGKQLAKKALGTVMRSTPLYADGKVYLCTNNGIWYVLQPSESGVKVLQKLRLKSEASDGSPIVAHGRIYLPLSGALYCIGKPDQTPSSDPLPEPVQEAPVSEDPQPALVQVEPYDALLSPGQQQGYQVRLYNSHGQLLEEVAAKDAKFRVEGPGSVSADGVYTASSDNGHETALIVCTVGALEGTARVRIVPPLPWKFDFNSGEKVPLTWVGGRVRYVIREQAGEKVAVKPSVLPTPKDPNNKLGTRSQMWMGSTDMANYTIQADFSLSKSPESGKMSDFGLINSRYTMAVRSSNRELRIYSWSPHDYRTYASVEFDPEPGRWYTMKLRVEPAGDKALVFGKLWPREQSEPDDWTVEMTDASPNLFGSPGFYGNSQEAEISIDNVSVLANE
ncbi:MAG: PQQ-binding-like beta-propeller repeat protein [Planctomycetales bacterium]|nr:PQQ-binding-like beta-propeller repeat protein [Planctomycetales bacterium]